MATEEGDQVGLKGTLMGPARLLQLGKSREGSEGGVSVAQEEVREEADVEGVQTTRGSCSPDEEGNEEGNKEGKSKGTRKPQKGVWRRVFSPAFTCFRRRRQPRPDTGDPGGPGGPAGASDRGAKRKRRFPVPTWPPPVFRNLLTSGRERRQGRPNVDPGAEGQLRVSDGIPGAEKPEEAVKLENNNDRNVLCLSEAGPGETEDAGRAPGRGLHLDGDNIVVVMEMSVQEPEAATESQLGCCGPVAEEYPTWPALHGPEERLMDGSCDPSENRLTSPPPQPPPPSSPPRDDLIDPSVAAANERLDDRAGPSDSSSEAEEATGAGGLSNGVHQGGVGIAMVTNDHIAHCLPSVETVVVMVLPVIRLNSGSEDGVSDWDAAPPVEDSSPLEDGVTAELDQEGKGGGGGGGDGGDGGEAELVLCAHAVVRAAMLAAVQQLLREQQNCVDHVHHRDPHHLSPNPY